MAESIVVLHAGDLDVEIVCDSTALESRFGPRFDRTAYVRQVTQRGRTFLAAPGLCDEFGLHGLGVLGFSEARCNETFTKLGVGRLVRGSRPDYFFAERYDVGSSFPVQVRSSPHSLHATQTTPEPTPWGYTYQKHYHLAGRDRLAIEYTLENRGERPFTFEQYNHHWFAFAGIPIGPVYTITPPGTGPEEPPPGWAAEGDRVFPAALVTSREGIAWRWSAAPGGNTVMLACREGGQQVNIKASFPPARFALWANDEAICPELFHQATLAPGASARWRVDYHFSRDARPSTASDVLHGA